MKYRPDKWAVRWAANWLNWAQMVLTSTTKSSWIAGTSGVPQEWTVEIMVFNILINDLEDGAGCTLSNLQIKWEELLLAPAVALPFIEGS